MKMSIDHTTIKNHLPTIDSYNQNASLSMLCYNSYQIGNNVLPQEDTLTSMTNNQGEFVFYIRVSAWQGSFFELGEASAFVLQGEI